MPFCFKFSYFNWTARVHFRQEQNHCVELQYTVYEDSSFGCQGIQMATHEPAAVQFTDVL